jgi:hypothetical protein
MGSSSVLIPNCEALSVKLPAKGVEFAYGSSFPVPGYICM